MATTSPTPKRTRARKPRAGGELAAPSAQTFDSLNPATGDVVGTYPIATPDEVAAAPSNARGSPPGGGPRSASTGARTCSGAGTE